MQNSNILHLDMDGVLTDFDAAFISISGGLTPDQYRQTKGKTGEASLFLSKGAEFWSNLEWLTGGKELVSFALDNFKVVRILTSAGTGKDWAKFKEVQAGKLKWLNTHLPQIEKKNVIVVPFANLKAARHSGPERILVDDKDTTINLWNKKGGIGILHHHSTWSDTIAELTDHIDNPEKVGSL